jgi:hypothetical protein
MEGMPTKTGVPAVNSSSDLAAYLTPRSTLLDSDQTTISVSWSAPSTLSPVNMPSYVDTDPTLNPPGQITIKNYVTVTVTYQWMPEIFMIGPITLTSTSTIPMQY